MTRPQPKAVACTGAACSCGVDRREFLGLAGLGSAALAAAGWPVMAGPFEPNEYADVIPANKKLDPAWVASLTARGEAETYEGWETLKYIGMPVGGIACGTIYLSGDGRLWLWDVFNRHALGILPGAHAQTTGPSGDRIDPIGGANYVNPQEPTSPLEVGFTLTWQSAEGSQRRSLDHTGFTQVRFTGQYPIGTVSYRDPVCPISVVLETFSPFIPLNTADSSLPATVMEYTLTNESGAAAELELIGALENKVCLHSAENRPGRRRSQIVHSAESTSLVLTAEADESADRAPRPAIVFEDFEKTTYEGWTVDGTAFGPGPIRKAEMPSYQGDVGGQGERVVNSHNVRAGGDVGAGDSGQGKLTSQPFTIARRYIRFFIGGGSHAGATCVNLVVDGQIVRTAAGHNQNAMRQEELFVAPFEGREARLEIVDRQTGGWGNIGVDQIVLADEPLAAGTLAEQPDFGSMTLALLGRTEADQARASRDAAANDPAEVVKPFSEQIIGTVGRRLTLAPGAKATVRFVLTWHFPNLSIEGLGRVGRWYAARFDSALGVANYVAVNFDRLAGQTRKWRDAWYNSTLPHWFLGRTLANASTLATSTCHRFRDGRFWAWEGIGCCAGTCTHVWHYAQAVGRLFPDLERDLRERTDFGIALDPNGRIRFRAEHNNRDAADGQAGVIMRTLREHQMSPDGQFLARVWPRAKQALEYLLTMDAADGRPDGMLEGEQHNTLDAEWFGKIPVIASLYLAALASGEALARDAGDTAFAQRCRARLDQGHTTIAELLNGEYFVQREDQRHLDAIGVGSGCYIDQVLGQGWAFQLGLGRLYDERMIRAALAALWKYNFAPDVGPFRKKFTRGRWYALAGDGGLVMCTWPKGGKRSDWEKHWQYMYFNECMSGFEHQAAGHMLWEGMITEGLAIVRAIHDRYHPRLRNPYNEVECSDHYARAMASYGVYLAACGYEYHGPQGHFGFAPKLGPEDFRAAFTAAEGWGTIAQTRAGGRQENRVTLTYGKLRLATLAFEAPYPPSGVQVTLASRKLPAGLTAEGHRVQIALTEPLVLGEGDELIVSIEA